MNGPPALASESSTLSQKMQLVIVALLPESSIPPPLDLAEFPLNVQLVTVELPLNVLYIPPPWIAELPLNVQLVTVVLIKR